MQPSPIEIANPDGSTRVVLPYARSWIDAEADYRASHPVQPPVIIAVAEPIITPSYNEVAANHKMSLRGAFYGLYGLYIEPVILFAKMNQPNFMQKNFH